eukprot:scaffold82888_cov22-Tisochrysis_lutea.AAC.1
MKEKGKLREFGTACTEQLGLRDQLCACQCTWSAFYACWALKWRHAGEVQMDSEDKVRSILVSIRVLHVWDGIRGISRRPARA